MANYKHNIILGLDNRQFRTGIENAARGIQHATSKIRMLSNTIATAFAVTQVRQIAGVVDEMVNLAGKADGVQQAFDRIAAPGLMRELEEATKNTVSQLELMQATTQAFNLGIDIKQLPTLLEFARRRAKETGQEVDYLVRSIVTGIGRKSPLILDNLGISTTQLKAAMHGLTMEAASVGQVTEAVAKIIDGAYKDLPEDLETAADKTAALNKKLEDQKVILGQRLTPAWNALKDAAITAMNMVSRALQTPEQEGVDLANYYEKLILGDGRSPVLIVEEFGLRLKGANKELENLQKQVDAINAGDYSSIDLPWYQTMVKQSDIDKVTDALAKQQSFVNELSGAYRKFMDTLMPNTTTEPVTNALDELYTELENFMELQKAPMNFAEWQELQRQIDATEAKIRALVLAGQPPTQISTIKKRGIPQISRAIVPDQTITRVVDDLQPITEHVETLTQELQFLGTVFQDVFNTALNSGEDFFTQMGKWIENFIKRMAAAAATAALLSAISGPGGIGFMAVFTQLIGLTKMAHGGIVDKPTPLVAGENGPEAIIPLHKLNTMGGGTLTTRISGRDLLILLEREQSVKNRMYG